jgi:hypothetical protein
MCSVITQRYESLRTRNQTLLSHLRLPQHRGTCSSIYIPQEQGDPVIPPGTGFPLRRLLRLASDDFQGYGGGILTHPQPGGPGPRIYIPQELDGQVQSQKSKSISMSWSLVHANLEVLHPNEFQSDIRRGILRRNFLCCHWEGCM